MPTATTNRNVRSAVGTPPKATVEVVETAPLPLNMRRHPAPSRARLIAAFAVVYIVWGSTYLAVRFGIESFPPLILGGLRHLTAGLILYPLARFRSREKPTAANWRAAA